MVVAAPLFFALVAALDPQSAAVLTGIVAAAAAEDPGVDVVTTEDLRRAIDVEANKSAIGCAEAQSCLAEIASAMDARVVLYGTAGQLDDQTVITLQLFDSKTGSSGGRGVAKSTSTSELSDKLAAETRRMIHDFTTRTPPAAGARLRVIVLDLKTGAPAPAGASGADEGGEKRAAQADADPGGGLSLLGLGGVGVAILGVTGIAVGVGIDALVVVPLNERGNDLATPQVELATTFRKRDEGARVAAAFYGVGAVVAVVGGVMAWLGFAQAGE